MALFTTMPSISFARSACWSSCNATRQDEPHPAGAKMATWWLSKQKIYHSLCMFMPISANVSWISLDLESIAREYYIRINITRRSWLIWLWYHRDSTIKMGESHTDLAGMKVDLVVPSTDNIFWLDLSMQSLEHIDITQHCNTWQQITPIGCVQGDQMFKGHVVAPRGSDHSWRLHVAKLPRSRR